MEAILVLIGAGVNRGVVELVERRDVGGSDLVLPFGGDADDHAPDPGWVDGAAPEDSPAPSAP